MSFQPPSRKRIDADFKRLEAALKSTPLPHSDGSSHTGEPGEFMWMNENGNGSVSFKHRESRNYITLSPAGTINIPTGKLFHAGVFDRFDRGGLAKISHLQREGRQIRNPFDPDQCGGAFDGTSVTSDADPGL